MSVTLATHGKYWYIQEFSGGGSVGFGSDEYSKRKPSITVGTVTTEDLGTSFQIIKVEEEDL